jgi:iron complex outermembrane receptor protein
VDAGAIGRTGYDAGRREPAVRSRQREQLDPAGIVPGYAAVNLDLRWQFDRRLALVANVGNLFNTRYQNFGILGANFFRGAGNTFAPLLAGLEEFVAPGAPFGIWIGVRYALADKTK